MYAPSFAATVVVVVDGADVDVGGVYKGDDCGQGTAFRTVRVGKRPHQGWAHIAHCHALPSRLCTFLSCVLLQQHSFFFYLLSIYRG